MNHSSRVSIVAASAAFLFVGAVAAQEANDGPAVVVETFGCTYNDGNDLNDMLAVAGRWNAWADERNLTTYAGSVLTPFLVSDQNTLDVGWLGVAPNGAAMGAVSTLYMNEGQELEADFQEVADCTSHTRYAARPIHVPEGGPAPNTGESPSLLSFSDCSILDGRTAQEAQAALAAWSEYLAENGHDGFSGVLYGLEGLRDDIDYNFKWIQAFPDMEAHGRVTDIVTGGGFRVAQNTLGRIVDCDSPRVYLVNSIRQMAPPE